MHFKKLVGGKCYLSQIDVNDAEKCKALNFHNIMLRVYEYNKGAIKCYEKIGFRQIGKRREALHRNLEKHDIIYMDILQGEFYKN